jgi:hypothetical protein
MANASQPSGGDGSPGLVLAIVCAGVVLASQQSALRTIAAHRPSGSAGRLSRRTLVLRRSPSFRSGSTAAARPSELTVYSGRRGSPAVQAPDGPARRGLAGARRLGTPAAGDEIELVGANLVSGGAAKFDGDGLAAVAVAQFNRPAAIVEPAVAPLHQRSEHREEIGALIGEPVTLTRALPRLPIVLALEQPVLHKLPKASGCHRLADPDALREVVEPRRSIEGLAQDQER